MIEGLEKYGWPKAKDLRGKFILNFILYDNGFLGASEACREIYYSN